MKLFLILTEAIPMGWQLSQYSRYQYPQQQQYSGYSQQQQLQSQLQQQQQYAQQQQQLQSQQQQYVQQQQYAQQQQSQMSQPDANWLSYCRLKASNAVWMTYLAIWGASASILALVHYAPKAV